MLEKLSPQFQVSLGSYSKADGITICKANFAMAITRLDISNIIEFF